MAWSKLSDGLKKLPQLLVQGRLYFDFDGIPQFAENISLKRRLNLIKTGLNIALNKNRLYGVPPIVQVEPTNTCNLKCPLCPTGSGTLKRSKGFMKIEQFENLLDNIGDRLIAVYLFCFGEPFLHKDLVKMIRMCTERNILTLTSTNGHFMGTMDEALELVDAGLKTLIIALDGTTKDIYSDYRINGDVEKVKSFIEMIETAKQKRQSSTPYTAVRTVVTQKNQGDLINLEKFAEKSGANMFTYKTVGCMVHGNNYKEYEPVKEQLRRFNYSGTTSIRDRYIRCPFPFRQPIVFCDGTMVGCEYDHHKELAYGRIGDEPFMSLWNSDNAIKLRGEVNSSEPCSFQKHCPYEQNAREGTQLSCTEFRPLGDVR